MSLDVFLKMVEPVTVYSSNITHNLGPMADEAGVYKHLWRPEEVGISRASQLIEPLTKAIELMKAEPDRFKRLDAPNRWGTYDDFVPWLERYLNACIEYPNADVSVWI